MPNFRNYLLTLLHFSVFLLTFCAELKAQKTLVTGQVKDGETREGLPFVNVYLKGSTTGATTDLDGYYKFQYEGKLPNDTLMVTFVGYQPAYFTIKAGETQELNFILSPDSQSLEEVVVVAGENPAYAILRKAAQNRSKYNKLGLKAYEHESYNQTELFLNKLGGISDSKVIIEIKNSLERDTAQRYLDKNGAPMIPFAVYETVSNYFYNQSPETTKEEILFTKNSSIGIEPDDGLNRLLEGNGFREFNFYNNRVRILDKFFPSPVADGWRSNYEMWLVDSLMVEGDFCYEILVEPRSALDIVFIGKIWITKEHFALKKLDLKLSEKANINFVKYIYVKQLMSKIPEVDIWAPLVTDVEMNLSEFSENFPGLVIRYHIVDKKFVPNKEQAAKFFDIKVSRDKTLEMAEESFWKKHREYPSIETQSDSLRHSPNIHQVIATIDTLPRVKKLSKTARIFGTGFIETPYVDFGHILSFYAWNNVEGSRLAFSFRTTKTLSKQLMLKGWTAFGTADQVWKYNGEFNYTPKSKRFTILGVRHLYDLKPIALIGRTLNVDFMFEFVSRWGNIKQQNPYYYRETELWFEREVKTGFRTKFTLRNVNYNAIPNLNGVGFSEGNPATITSTEAEVALTFAKHERAFLRRDNTLKLIGPQRAPTVKLSGIFGFQGLLGADFSYQKVVLDISQKQKEMFGFGTATYTFSAGYIFNRLPYPLLKIHQGNPSPFLFLNAFQAMRGFEFVSDYYAELHYTHFFNGLILNRIPVLKLLSKWFKARLFASTSLAWGGLSATNATLIPQVEKNGVLTNYFRTLSPDNPYAEVGYGLENIFRLIRIDFVHRLTYLDNLQGSPFVIKVSAQVKF
ncbi:MAG TPA: hypothetical protein DCM08_04585 [Microscillaceae bacterium]|nr:hypothetical protein [Microscillaceae bacterium]